jgi:transcriptional regulator GlxA family with amidase domain
MHTVAVVAFQGISPFHLSVPCVVFGDPVPGGPQYVLRVCAMETGAISTTAGFTLNAAWGLEGLADADILIVPSWRDPEEAAPQALLDALIEAQRRGAQIIGLCLGAYVLAQAGLLHGRRATTHWAYADDFARRHPTVALDAQVLYVQDDNVLTSAGTSAGIDCCLHLLRQQCGVEVANRVARRLVAAPHRQGGQAQYIEHPLPATDRNARLASLLDWVRAHLDQSHSVESLAQRAHMSRRTFTRQFTRLVGTPVAQWLLNERLGRAQQLLESSNESIDSIALHAGFGSPVSMRQQFRKSFGVSPSQWRATFRGDAG